MDKRISYKIIIDTETCPLDRDLEGVVPSNMFTYDIGWVVADKRGQIFKTRSFLVMDIFYGEKDLMQNAYYKEKIPGYIKKLNNREIELKTFYEIYSILLEDIEHFSVKEIFAHNMRFDYGSLNNTKRWLTKSKYRYFFPKEIDICDTLKMARDVIAIQPTYRRFCEENGYMTKNNRVKLTAEVIFRYITKNTNFVESHTALEDALIESTILAYCYKQHKKMRKKLYD